MEAPIVILQKAKERAVRNSPMLAGTILVPSFFQSMEFLWKNQDKTFYGTLK